MTFLTKRHVLAAMLVLTFLVDVNAKLCCPRKPPVITSDDDDFYEGDITNSSTYDANPTDLHLPQIARAIHHTTKLLIISTFIFPLAAAIFAAIDPRTLTMDAGIARLLAAFFSGGVFGLAFLLTFVTSVIYIFYDRQRSQAMQNYNYNQTYHHC